MGQGKSSKTVEHWIRERSKPIFHPLVGAGGMRKKTKKKKKKESGTNRFSAQVGAFTFLIPLSGMEGSRFGNLAEGVVGSPLLIVASIIKRGGGPFQFPLQSMSVA